MKRFSEQLKRKADGLRLSSAEKHELRSRLLSYMEYHPIPGAAKQSRVPSRLSVFASNFYIARASGVFAIFILAIVPILAENAVPGDVLYPVKVRINEEVQSTLARSPYAKVEWETERLERRLAEARLLANEGKLTPEVEAEVAEAVREHSEAAQEGIATLRASDSDAAAIAEITLSSALDVQSEMLEGGSDTLVSAVDTARLAAKESQQNNRPSYEKLIARIENESTRAYELMNAIEAETTEKERDDVGRRMREIERRVAEGIEQSDDNADEAVALLTNDLADLRKLISFMTNIDVRANVTINDLVPTPMTDEERLASVEETLSGTTALEAEIRGRLDSVDANTRIAVEARLAEMTEFVTAAHTALDAGDVNAAEAASDAAATIAREVGAVLDQVGGEVGTSTEATTTPPATSTEIQ